MKRAVLVACLLLIALPLAGFAQEVIDTEHESQFWPDMTVTLNFNKEWSSFVYGTARLGRGWTTFNNEQIGVGVNRKLNPHLSTTFSYRHIWSVPLPGKRVSEDRLYADLTLRQAFRGKYLVQDRNRIEWRKVNGKIMYRYRNRLQFERPIDILEKRVTPYVAAEPYYDFRYQAWSRLQIYTGTRVPVAKHVTLDGFFMHQWDSRAKPGYINTVGATWKIDF